MHPRPCAAVLGAVTSAAALIASSATPVQADQGYYWRWSDGSEQGARTFDQDIYGSPSSLPRLLVTAAPASPRRTVTVQFRYSGGWVTESSARTGADGVARIALNPLCEADRWCDETLQYRLVVAGQTASLTITYRR